MSRPIPPLRQFREDTLEKATHAGVRGKWATMALIDAERGYLLYRINEADSLASRAISLSSLIISQEARIIGLVWQDGDTLNAFVASPTRQEYWKADILSKRKADISEWQSAEAPGPLAHAAMLALNKANPDAAFAEAR